MPRLGISGRGIVGHRYEIAAVGGIRYLIVAGVVTDLCVDMAVRDAADRGYLVSVPHDASATYSEARHENALKAYGGYCWVTGTGTVVARIDAITGAAA